MKASNENQRFQKEITKRDQGLGTIDITPNQHFFRPFFALLRYFSRQISLKMPKKGKKLPEKSEDLGYVNST